jgi:hypothetical protein
MPLLFLACNPPLPDLHDATRDLTGSLPVFPGAEGFGTDTPAGREGAIFVVDTLAAEGPGSLKEALVASEPRVVVFSVGGVIKLTENITVDEPFLTVAGQTAPEPGITLSGAGLEIRTHDVLVQHLRIRPGDDPEGPDPDTRDAVAVVGLADGSREVHHVVIDHCSLSWGIDENFSTWYRGVRDVSLLNSLVSEALDDSLHYKGPHGKGVLVGDHIRRFSMINNILAYNPDRNPIIKGDVSALVANLYVHDPDRWPVTLFDPEGAGPSLFSLVGGYFTRGPDTPIEHATVLIDRTVKKGTEVFLEDLTSWDIGDDPWVGVDVMSNQDQVRVDTAPVGVAPLTGVPSGELPDFLLDRVGARPAFRDPVDARVVGQLRDNTGGVIDSPVEVGGLPDLPERHAELELPEDPSGDLDGDGYTNLEEWLFAYAAAVEGAASE